VKLFPHILSRNILLGNVPSVDRSHASPSELSERVAIEMSCPLLLDIADSVRCPPTPAIASTHFQVHALSTVGFAELGRSDNDSE
jgi:hypothetical protein